MSIGYVEIDKKTLRRRASYCLKAITEYEDTVLEKALVKWANHLANKKTLFGKKKYPAKLTDGELKDLAGQYYDRWKNSFSHTFANECELFLNVVNPSRQMPLIIAENKNSVSHLFLASESTDYLSTIKVNIRLYNQMNLITERYGNVSLPQSESNVSDKTESRPTS